MQEPPWDHRNPNSSKKISLLVQKVVNGIASGSYAVWCQPLARSMVYLQFDEFVLYAEELLPSLYNCSKTKSRWKSPFLIWLRDEMYLKISFPICTLLLRPLQTWVVLVGWFLHSFAGRHRLLLCFGNVTASIFDVICGTTEGFSRHLL